MEDRRAGRDVFVPRLRMDDRNRQLTSSALDYRCEQPIHPIPSSLIKLNEEDKLDLESVIFELVLESVGLK